MGIKDIIKNKKTKIISTKDSLKDIEPWFDKPFEEYKDGYSNDDYVNGDYNNKYDK